ncbi:hypothetical protein SAMN05421858_3377 [Haladaptatus litoreus]|uniref:Uncharacterized protein n=1 Tax=Haladaptatus litoreus TaxID=553468 RepID=A0A1N7D0H5_9EURY|nr:hypothetical protein SAMN05421858_3377 [Haladaptatus litoreus]
MESLVRVFLLTELHGGVYENRLSNISISIRYFAIKLISRAVGSE